MIPYFDSVPSSLVGEHVEVYRNLHKTLPDGTPVYSVRSSKTKRVIAHTASVSLSRVVFKVSQHGKDKVRKEKRKNVHAVVTGTIVDSVPSLTLKARYNPYLFDSFVNAETLESVTECSFARVSRNGVEYV